MLDVVHVIFTRYCQGRLSDDELRTCLATLMSDLNLYRVQARMSYVMQHFNEAVIQNTQRSTKIKS